MLRRHAPWRLWLGRVALVAVVLAGLLLVLWGARAACELNPGCPWSIMWRTR